MEQRKPEKREVIIGNEKDKERWSKIASHTDKEIKGFFGDYRYLSNFHVCFVEHEGILYSSSEAAYQAAKYEDKQYRSKFASFTPGEAKKYGRAIPLRHDWEEVKKKIMEEICLNKFTINKDIRQKLISTGDRYLEETNWWNDTYWGVYQGKGENNLGKILMNIRDKIK